MSDFIDGSALHVLPADAYPGMLDGWCGPVLGPSRIGGLEFSAYVWPCGKSRRSLHLDLHRPECIDRVIRVLRADGHDLSWASDLPAWQAGAILAASVLRVVAGERPIRTPLVRVRSGWGFAGNPTPLWLDAGQPLAASHALDNTDHIRLGTDTRSRAGGGDANRRPQFPTIEDTANIDIRGNVFAEPNNNPQLYH